MKRYIELLLILALLLPMVHDLHMAECPIAVTADGGQLLDNEEADDVVRTAPTQLSISILLKATTLRRFSIVRVKTLRLLRQRPIIHSESPRRSGMRSGDVPTLRI